MLFRLFVRVQIARMHLRLDRYLKSWAAQLPPAAERRFDDAALRLPWPPPFPTSTLTREGWDVFDSDGSLNGDWQIQHFADADECDATQLDSDETAWDLAWRGAAAGHREHLHALAFIRQRCPREWLNICQHRLNTDPI